jgi:hypothetical protein
VSGKKSSSTTWISSTLSFSESIPANPLSFTSQKWWVFGSSTHKVVPSTIIHDAGGDQGAPIPHFQAKHQRVLQVVHGHREQHQSEIKSLEVGIVASKSIREPF